MGKDWSKFLPTLLLNDERPIGKNLSNIVNSINEIRVKAVYVYIYI